MDTDKGNEMQTKVVDPMIDALMSNEAEAIDNGPGYARARENRMVASNDGFGPLVIKRLPAGRWECDTCGTHGAGWRDIEKHFARTEHRVFTETR